MSHDERFSSVGILDPLASFPPAPPLGGALAAELAHLAPVSTRSPKRAFVVLAIVGVSLVALPLARFGLRRDLPFLPKSWVVTMAVLWAAGFIATAWAATIPPPRAVLPDAARAGRRALLVAGLLMLLGLFATVDAAGHTWIPEPTFAGFAARWLPCTIFGVVIVLPFLIASAIVLWRLVPMGGARVAAAVGAAGGAAAGLLLNLVCPVGGPLHVGLSHGGLCLIGAALAMLVLPRAIRR